MTTPTTPTMTPLQFIAKWRDAGFGERQAAQTWFLDVLRLVGHPDPVEVNDADNFTFEKPVPGGVADAYLAGRFAWEFKGADAQLPGAFDQLLRYQVYLRTPPLLIVSSFQTVRIQTNFRGKETVVYEIPVSELEDPDQLGKLRSAFFSPEDLEPGRTVEEVTQETARLFGRIAGYMEDAGIERERLARFLNQIVFCLYAEDTGLLPDRLLTDIARTHYRNPAYFNAAVRDLFGKMRGGGLFGKDPIARFNGDLFNGSDTVELSDNALFVLANEVVEKNWRNIEPSIFGTLFEGALDATKRARLGAHYTGADDIALVVEPVVMKPLRREWRDAKNRIESLIADGERGKARAALDAFLERLRGVTVLDPACGSGNFLYIALRSLLDLEKEVIDCAETLGWGGMIPEVNPSQMAGIEIDYYAAELARTALWIGYIQWHQTNGFPYTRDPILMPLDTIQQTDAILDMSDADNPTEVEWAPAEFIIGNPPFLGHNPFRRQLGDEYADALYSVFDGRIPNSSDLCCYWLEKARAQISDGKAKRARLLATQAIRFQSNRPTLARIKETGDIFNAVSDRDWILDGANVHVSIICFDGGDETERTLDGVQVPRINADLTGGADLTRAKRLAENRNLAFQGISKVGAFDIPESVTVDMLSQPNPHGKPNADVLKRWFNGKDITSRPSDTWIIDFGTDASEDEAALYEAPFEYAKENVRPGRMRNKAKWLPKNWWFHGHLRVNMRKALSPLPRFIGTSVTGKHRLFAWMPGGSLPSSSVIVIARDDDYTFGVLHSRIHELWARSKGTQLRELQSGFRYLIAPCFETFPFPNATDGQRDAIADAARELNRLRENWLNPTDSDGNPALGANQLRLRTLTNLYNRRPTWLANVHARLDDAVFAAYGWDGGIADHEVLEGLLGLNLRQRGEGAKGERD